MEGPFCNTTEWAFFVLAPLTPLCQRGVIPPFGLAQSLRVCTVRQEELTLKPHFSFKSTLLDLYLLAYNGN